MKLKLSKKHILFSFAALFVLLIIAGVVFKSRHMSVKPTFSIAKKSNEKFVSGVPATPTPTPTPTPVWSSKYIVHDDIYATMFWVGEKASGANDYIPNEASAWDTHWLERFGGIDNPYKRDGYYPHGFTPKENPFYFALPYTEYGPTGLKASAYTLPWYTPGLPENTSILKNKWIRIKYENSVCYGQWQDAGPFEYDDYEYVFEGEEPKNDRAGIDLSPALKHCLKMATNDHVSWQFVDDEEVPDGPWKKIVTTSQINWR